jgi:hypothetical protein
MIKGRKFQALNAIKKYASEESIGLLHFLRPFLENRSRPDLLERKLRGWGKW